MLQKILVCLLLVPLLLGFALAEQAEQTEALAPITLVGKDPVEAVDGQYVVHGKGQPGAHVKFYLRSYRHDEENPASRNSRAISGYEVVSAGGDWSLTIPAWTEDGKDNFKPLGNGSIYLWVKYEQTGRWVTLCELKRTTQAPPTATPTAAPTQAPAAVTTEVPPAPTANAFTETAPAVAITTAPTAEPVVQDVVIVLQASGVEVLPFSDVNFRALVRYDNGAPLVNQQMVICKMGDTSVYQVIKTNGDGWIDVRVEQEALRREGAVLELRTMDGTLLGQCTVPPTRYAFSLLRNMPIKTVALLALVCLAVYAVCEVMLRRGKNRRGRKGVA